MSNSPRSFSRTDSSSLLAAGSIVAVTLLAYANSFSGAFVFDDISGIRDNPTLRALWPLTQPLAPPANSGLGGRPLANLSLALNYAFGGTAVDSYHAANLALHLGSALLLFGIIRRTLRQLSPWPAAFATAAWAVHPLTTATVTWISQRTEGLMAFFYLLTLYAFIRSVAEQNRRWLVGSAIACACGMMSKEVMATAPVFILFYDRTFAAGSFRAAWNARRGYYIGLGATWLILACLLTTGLAQRSVGFDLGVAPLDYALTECRAVLFYLKLAIWPFPQVFDYGPIYSANVLITTACVSAVAVLLAGAVFLLRRFPVGGFAAAGFFLLLAPTSTFVPIAEQPMAENRMYLPLAVLAAALAGLLVPTLARVGRAIWVLPIVALGIATWARNETYRSELSVWRDTVQKRPENPRANYNYGIALLEAAHPADALGYFERAAQLNPREPKHHNSLGNALLELGRPADALPHYAEAVRLQPTYARAWFNYGTALLRSGDARQAIDRFDHALQLDPKSAEIQNAVGNAFFQLDRPAEAVVHYEAALRLEPTHADAHYNCGSAYLELNRLEDAIGHFAAAARLKPADAEIRNNYGAALLRSGRRTDAIAEFQHALRLRPGYAEAKSNLELAQRF